MKGGRLEFLVPDPHIVYNDADRETHVVAKVPTQYASNGAQLFSERILRTKVKPEIPLPKDPLQLDDEKNFSGRSARHDHSRVVVEVQRENEIAATLFRLARLRRRQKLVLNRPYMWARRRGR